jgi:hypothetical protein
LNEQSAGQAPKLPAPSVFAGLGRHRNAKNVNPLEVRKMYIAIPHELYDAYNSGEITNSIFDAMMWLH